MRGVKSKREGSDLDCIFSFHRVQEAGRKAGSVEEGRQKEEEGRKAHTDRQTTFARTRLGREEGLLASLVHCLFQAVQIPCNPIEDSTIFMLKTGF